MSKTKIDKVSYTLTVDKADEAVANAEKTIEVGLDAGLRALKAIHIIDREHVAIVHNDLKAVVGVRRKIKSFFKEAKERAHEAHKSIIAMEKAADAEPARIEAILRKGLNEYEAAERKRIAAEEKAERERQAKLEAEGKVDFGLTEIVDGGQAKAVKKPEQTTGLSTMKTIEVKIAEPHKLIQAIAFRKAPITWVDFNIGDIRKYAREYQKKHGQLPSLPGCTVTEEHKVRV